METPGLQLQFSATQRRFAAGPFEPHLCRSARFGRGTRGSSRLTPVLRPIAGSTHSRTQEAAKPNGRRIRCETPLVAPSCVHLRGVTHRTVLPRLKQGVARGKRVRT